MLVNLTIKTIDRRIFNISIEDSLTVYDIKSELMNKYNIDIQTQKLFLKGRMITNDSSIVSLNISKDDIFILFIFTKKSSPPNEINPSQPPNINETVDTPVSTSSNTEILNNTETDEITYFREDDNENEVHTYPCIDESPKNTNNESSHSDNFDDEFDDEFGDEFDYNPEENVTDTEIDFPSLSDTDEDIDNSHETVPNNTPNNDNDDGSDYNNIQEDTIDSTINTLSAVITTLNNNVPNIENNENDINTNTVSDTNTTPAINNTNNTESILSIIQTNIIQNIHRDSQFINNLNPDDLSEIITNHISQNAVNFETPESTLDSLVEMINNNPLISRYITSNQDIEPEETNTDCTYEVTDELIEYGITFFGIIKKSPDILGIWVKSQETMELFDICISKIEIFDTKLADYILNNNDKFFQYIYEKMNDIEPGTTKRSDIFKPKNNTPQRLQNIFQNVLNTHLNNNSTETEPVVNASVQISPIEITEEHNLLIDKISEIFPHLSRTSIYIALQVNDFNEDMAINYLFDYHE